MHVMIADHWQPPVPVSITLLAGANEATERAYRNPVNLCRSEIRFAQSQQEKVVGLRTRQWQASCINW
jgi:hypothetical protein